ncbi:MAG: DoxX family membrane protein [Pseudomonadota bacterium]
MTVLDSGRFKAGPLALGLAGPGPDTLTLKDEALIALWLRVGIGLVFLIGGWWKLSRALDPARAEALVSRYTAPDGYINAFFQDYLFAGGWITPWSFLTALSALELVAGIVLIAGVFVRPMAILFGLMLWSFVAALPVMTTPGLAAEDKTFLTPALIVQIRDVGLSGLCFVLAALGSGAWSVDHAAFGRGQVASRPNWPAIGLVLRLSVAAVFITGGFFYGLDHVKSWSSLPVLMIAIGLVMASGHGVRLTALAALGVLIVYCVTAMSADKTLWGNLNAVKREAAFIAAAAVLLRYSGGPAFRVGQFFAAPVEALFGAPAKSPQS